MKQLRQKQYHPETLKWAVYNIPTISIFKLKDTYELQIPRKTVRRKEYSSVYVVIQSCYSLDC